MAAQEDRESHATRLASPAGIRRRARRVPAAAVKSARAATSVAADRAAAIRARFTSIAAMSPRAKRRSVALSRSRAIASAPSATLSRSVAAMPCRKADAAANNGGRAPTPALRPAGAPRLRGRRRSGHALAAGLELLRQAQLDDRSNVGPPPQRGPAAPSITGLSRKRVDASMTAASASATRARATTTAPDCSRARAMVCEPRKRHLELHCYS